jgi:hypothetical protein
VLGVLEVTVIVKEAAALAADEVQEAPQATNKAIGTLQGPATVSGAWERRVQMGTGGASK